MAKKRKMTKFIRKLKGSMTGSRIIGLSEGRYFSRAVIVFAAVVIGAVGAYLLVGSHAATSTTLYVSSTGNDGTKPQGSLYGNNTCTQQTAPCLTFDQAYHEASLSDTVQVAAGVYPAQTINYDSTKPSDNSAADNSNVGNITFQPASGASVYFSGSITVLSSHVTIKNMIMGDPNAAGNAGQSNPQLWTNKFDVNAYDYVLGTGPKTLNPVGFITFQNITARNVEIIGTHDVSVLGGSYGPASCDGSSLPSLTQYGGGNNAIRAAAPNYPSGGPFMDPYNILFDGTTVHNIYTYNPDDCHSEGLAVFAGSVTPSTAPAGSSPVGGVTVRNSKFYGNDIYDILAQANAGASALGQITLENNWFAMSTHPNGGSPGKDASYWALEIDGDTSNVSMLNNSFNGPMNFLSTPPYSNVSIIGNIMPDPVYAGGSNGSMCGASGVNAQDNITVQASGLSCTKGNRNIEVSSLSSFYTNPSNQTLDDTCTPNASPPVTTGCMNYNLKAGSQPLNYVPVSDYPSGTAPTNDIDYHCRATTGSIDAGASELGSTGSCGDPISGSSGGGGGGTTNTAPTVSITAPTNSASVNGTTPVTATAAATTTGATISKVQFQVDGQNVGTADTSSPYAYSWDTTGANNGTHTLSAIATDSNGLTTTASNVSVTVNNTVSTPGCTTTVGSATNSASNNATALTNAVNGAASGDTVCAVGGSYGAMTWSGGSGRTSKVIVKAADDSKPAVFTGQLTITGSQIELRNTSEATQSISLAGQLYQINAPAHDIQLTNIDAGHFEIDAIGSGTAQTSAVQKLTIKGGSIGPWHSYPDNRITNQNGTTPNYNIVIDGVTFHDFTVSQSSGTHFECLQVWAADGLTIKNSKFVNCSYFDIFLQKAAATPVPPAPTNVLIENNFLDCCSYTDIGYSPNYSIMLPTDHGEGAWNNITIRNNSGDDAYDIGYKKQPATFSGDIIENNIAPRLDFDLPGTMPPAGIKIDYNEWYSGSTIGGNDLTGASTGSLFTNFAGQDFHLKSGAPVIGKADPTTTGNPPVPSYPLTDIDGNPRPASNGPDIGANEPPGSAPPTCTTGTLLPPTGVSQNGTPTYTTIGLKWTAPSPTSGCTITGYKIFRNGTQVGTTTGATTYNDSGLASGTGYTYTVQATDSGSNTSAPSTGVKLTTTADNLAPNMPTGVTATAADAAQINLSWNGVTDNPASGASGLKGYNIYRGTSLSNISSTPLNSSPLQGTTYNDTSGLSPSTTYYYVVTAIDNNQNESSPSTSANATTASAVPTCSSNPSAPGLPTKQNTSLTSLSFTWTASQAANGCTLSGYNIYRADVSTNNGLIGTVSSGTSFTDSGLTANTSYTYTVKAFDTSGHSSAGATATVTTAADIAAPTFTSNVAAVAASAGQVNLAWSAATDNVGVVGYRIYRADVTSGPIATVSGSTLSYPDTTVKPNSSYSYQVSAIDAANNESAKVTATPNPVRTPATVDGTAPTTPTNLAAPAITADAASLTWTASTDNVGVVGYHVYLNGIYDGDSNSTSFALSCIATGVNYTVTVKAFDAAGNVSAAVSKGFTSLNGGLAGDVNCDNSVNSTDLFTVLRNWQTTDALPPNGDINGDAAVNSTDLFTLLRNWGKSL